jgi:hypothetical protein
VINSNGLAIGFPARILATSSCRRFRRRSFVGILHIITFSLATMKKDPVPPQEQTRSGRQKMDSLKTLAEQATCPLEPFKIADVRLYLLLFQQLASKDSRESM